MNTDGSPMLSVSLFVFFNQHFQNSRVTPNRLGSSLSASRYTISGIAFADRIGPRARSAAQTP